MHTDTHRSTNTFENIFLIKKYRIENIEKEKINTDLKKEYFYKCFHFLQFFKHTLYKPKFSMLWYVYIVVTVLSSSCHSFQFKGLGWKFVHGILLPFGVDNFLPLKKRNILNFPFTQILKFLSRGFLIHVYVTCTVITEVSSLCTLYYHHERFMSKINHNFENLASRFKYHRRYKIRY